MRVEHNVYCDACGEIAKGGCHQPASVHLHNGADESWGGSGWEELQAENILRSTYPNEFFSVLVCGYLAQEEVYICHDCQYENFDNYVVEFVRKVRAHRGQLLTKLIAEAKIPELVPAEQQKEKQLAEYDKQLEDLCVEMSSAPLLPSEARDFIERAMKIEMKRKLV